VAAEKQFADARAVLKLFEDGERGLTYGRIAELLGRGRQHGRHLGQVCSLIDAACYWAKLPMFSAENVRTDDGNYNSESFQGVWASAKDGIVANARNHVWTHDDINRIRRALTHMNDESALLQWQKIESFGQAAVERLLSYR
jgi:hypothetical protein